MTASTALKTKTFLCWNVAKNDVIGWALETIKPDVALFQEYDRLFSTHPEAAEGEMTSSSSSSYSRWEAISFDDRYGTAIFSRDELTNVYSVSSPHPDYRLNVWKGMTVSKCTAIATLRHDGLTVVSFHGYNGTFQGRDPEKLVAHIDAVLRTIDRTKPCVFAGDFNTFGNEHCQAVSDIMSEYDFKCDIQVPYEGSKIAGFIKKLMPGRFSQKTLDWVYTRGCHAELLPDEEFKNDNHFNQSDHPLIYFRVTFE